MKKCRHCGKTVSISPEQRQELRTFNAKYPFISQRELAALWSVSATRMNEIINGNSAKGGE